MNFSVQNRELLSAGGYWCFIMVPQPGTLVCNRNMNKQSEEAARTLSLDGESMQAKLAELSEENARLRGDLLTLAHRISHDLRTPLGSISVSTEMVKELGADRAEIPSSLTDSIFGATDEIIKLLERVSFVLKASAKPAPLEKLDMGRVVFEVREKLERVSVKKKAMVTSSENWPEVDGVTTWLRVIWWNLLANSLQHSPDGVKIRLGWKPEGDVYRFWVEDSGGGVPVERAGKVFQSFQTLHEPEAKKGVGLAIVRRLVELQNGQCGYQPGESGGSIFYFTLPMRQPGAKVPGLPEESNRKTHLSMAGASR